MAVEQAYIIINIMTAKETFNTIDIIKVIIPVLTFLLGGILVYWRENKKSFQEKIFDYKYIAYKEILQEIGMYYEEVYSLLNTYQFFEGTQDEWRIEFSGEFKKYVVKARKIDKLYYKNLNILPENLLTKLREFNFLAYGHLTHHAKINRDLPHRSYERLWELLLEFAEESRKDLSTDILNVTLSKRLSQQFYPISIPRKKIN